MGTNNDSISSITKVSENEFEFFIDPNFKSETFTYWTILKAPNTIFEWSYVEGNKEHFDYSRIWNVMRGILWKNEARRQLQHASTSNSRK